jgi:hypothetical protein
MGEDCPDSCGRVSTPRISSARVYAHRGDRSWRKESDGDEGADEINDAQASARPGKRARELGPAAGFGLATRPRLTLAISALLCTQPLLSRSTEPSCLAKVSATLV